MSVDTKKKELVGAYKNGGREWQPKGSPAEANVHDFIGPEGRAVHGVYDVTADAGWVSVGKDNDTSTFAVATLRRWWQSMGQPTYPEADRLLICADGGGSNGSRTRLWKVELAKLAAETGLSVTVCHLPPGTSKPDCTERLAAGGVTAGVWLGGVGGRASGRVRQPERGL